MAKYIYVIDENGVVHRLPHQDHNHSEILGGDHPVTGAGEIVVEGGVVIEINNLSGHLQFPEEILVWVHLNIEEAGVNVAPGADDPWTGGY
jgi:hypothetical protein